MVDTAQLADVSFAELSTLDSTSRRLCRQRESASQTMGSNRRRWCGSPPKPGGSPTVYRRFGSKKTLVRLAILDEALRVTALVAAVAERAESADEELVEVFVAFVSEASAAKLLTRSIRESPSAGELATFLTDDSAIATARGLVATSRTRWQRRGQLAADLDPEVVGEMIARLMMSLVMSPISVIPVKDPVKAREFASRYLTPLLKPNALGQAPQAAGAGHQGRKS